MQLYDEDEGWTVVHRRRGRDRHHGRPQSSHNRHHHRPCSACPTRPSYAAVLQYGRTDAWDQRRQDRSHRYDVTPADRSHYARRCPAPRQRRETHRLQRQIHSGQQSQRTTARRPGPDPHQSRHPERRTTAAPPPDPPRHQSAQRAPGQTHRGHSWVDTQDPNFTIKVRHIYKIIKAQHHKCSVEGQTTPPFIKRIMDHLKTAIKPAFFNPKFRDSYADTVESWEQCTVANLHQHYTDCMDNEMAAIDALPAYDWRGPFRIAESWACRNLGRRLSQEAVQQAETFIDKHLTPPPQAGNLPQQPPPAPATAAAPPPSSSASATSGLPVTLPVAMATQQSTAEIAAPARHTPVCTASTSIHLQPATENNDTFISRCKDNAAKPGQSAPLDLPLFSSPLPPRAARRQAVHVPPVLASPISAGTQGTSGTSPRRASTHQPSSSSTHKNLLIEAETELSQALSSSPPLLATPLPRDVLSPGLSPIQRGSTHLRPRPLSTPVLSEDEDTLPEEVNQLLSTRPSQTPVSGPPPPPPAGRRLTRQSSVACQTPPLHRRAR